MCTGMHGNAGVRPILLLPGAGLLMVRGCLQPCHSTAWAGGATAGLFLGGTEIQIIRGFAEERGQVWEGAFYAHGGRGCCCQQLPMLGNSMKMWGGSPLFHFKLPMPSPGRRCSPQKGRLEPWQVPLSYRGCLYLCR